MNHGNLFQDDDEPEIEEVEKDDDIPTAVKAALIALFVIFLGLIGSLMVWGIVEVWNQIREAW